MSHTFVAHSPLPIIVKNFPVVVMPGIQHDLMNKAVNTKFIGWNIVFAKNDPIVRFNSQCVTKGSMPRNKPGIPNTYSFVSADSPRNIDRIGQSSVKV